MTRNQVIRIIITLVVIALLIIFGIKYFKKDKTTTANADQSVAAYNQTQNSDATKVTARPGDVIVYTLNASNPTDNVISGYVIEAPIGGLTNTATLIDAQGANYSSENVSLVWTPLDIAAHDSIQKQFTMRVKETLPQNTSDKDMKITYGNDLLVHADNVAVAATPPPVTPPATTPTSRPTTSGTSYNAPTTGIPGWISFYLAAFITFGIWLFRVARKMGRPTN